MLPWASGIVPSRTGRGPIDFLGSEGAADGLLLGLLAAGIAALTLHPAPAGSRIRTVRVLPLVLLVLAVASLENGRRGALAAVAAWTVRGGEGGLGIGFWLAAAGTALLAAGLARLVPAAVAPLGTPGDPADAVVVRPAEVAAALAGVAGAVLGCAAGIAAGLRLAGALPGLLAFLAILGGFLGAWAAARGTLVLAARLGRRGGPGV